MCEIENEMEYVTATVIAAGQLSPKQKQKQKSPDIIREKTFWENGYQNWSNAMFKKKLRVRRETFVHILNYVRPHLEKTNMKPDLISVERQLALTLYHLAHAATYNELEIVYGISESLRCKTFNKVVRVVVATMYDVYVSLPVSEQQWMEELAGFTENYGFPCVGAWDGFHVYVNLKLKNNFSLKKRYSRTNLGLVSYNKRILYAGVSAPGSVHDYRLLKSSSIFLWETSSKYRL